jgi:hypothetical protein
MPTTFRSDVAVGILAVLNAFIAAHPTLLLRAYRARPENVTVDMPAAFIDARPESVTHDSQIRTRLMSPSVVVVRAYTDNPETMTAFDTLVDLLVDAFTAQPQFAAGTMWDTFTVADEEYEIGEYLYPAVRFTFADVTIMEGRV